MSQALASARKRRAPAAQIEAPTNIRTQSQSQSQPQSGLTLPQVISLVDKRLTTLEKFKTESEENKFKSSDNATPSNLTEIFNEYETRFEIIINELDLTKKEITTLKDLLMNLQSFTMDVNKTLMQERVKILSDLGEESTNINLETV